MPASVVRERSTSRRARWFVATALSVLPVLFGSARAQEAPPPEPPRNRMGLGSQQPSTPSFATPQTGAVTPGDPPPALIPLDGARLVIGSLIVESTSPVAARPSPKWSSAPPTADGLKLEIGSGEAFDADWLRRQFEVNGLLNAEVGADQIVALVQIVNRAFLDNGYVNSGVILDAQDWPARGGALRVSLVTGRIVSVKPNTALVDVTWTDGGDHGLGAKYFADRLPALAASPFNAFALERDFRLLAEDPAVRTVNAKLLPGAAPGEAQVALKVDPQPRFDLYLSVANSRSPSVGGERGAIGGSARNVLFDGDLVTAEYGVTEGLSDAVVSYATPFLSPRNTFDVRAEINQANVVDAALRPLDIESESASTELGLTHRFVHRPLAPRLDGSGWRPARTISGGVRIARKESETSLLGLPFSFSPGAVDGRTEITVARLTGDWIERGEKRAIAASVTVNAGLDGTGSDIPGIVQPKANFTSALVQLNYARKLNNNGLEVRARVAGQWASGLLYTAERFSVGGESTVRGYRESLLLADTGVLGSVELVQPFSLSGGRRNAQGGDWGAFIVSAFADAAVVRNEAGPDPAPDSISSVGVSLAWTPSPALSARITYGAALADADSIAGDDLQDDGVHFRVTLHPLHWLRRRG